MDGATRPRCLFILTTVSINEKPSYYQLNILCCSGSSSVASFSPRVLQSIFQRHCKFLPHLFYFIC